MKILDDNGKVQEYRLVSSEKQLYCPYDRTALHSKKAAGDPGVMEGFCPRCKVTWQFNHGAVGLMKKAKGER